MILTIISRFAEILSLSALNFLNGKGTNAQEEVYSHNYDTYVHQTPREARPIRSRRLLKGGDKKKIEKIEIVSDEKSDENMTPPKKKKKKKKLTTRDVKNAEQWTRRQ